MMVSMRDFPTKERYHECAMHDKTYRVIYNFIIGESLMSTFVGDNP